MARYVPAIAAWPRVLAVLALVFSLLVLATVACQTAKPGGVSGPVPRGSWLAVAEEHGDHADLMLVSASRPADRRRIAAVAHRPNWGVRGSVAPDGRTIAYVALPRTATDPDTEAELWVLSIGTNKARWLAAGVDLRSSLVWSPDGAWVSYERVLQQEAIQVRRVNASGAGDEQIARSGLDQRWYLMGYAPDGRAVELAHLTGAGTEVVTQTLEGAVRSRSTISLTSSRDFTVSPDGRPALLTLTSENARRVYRAVELGPDGTAVRLTSGGDEDTGIAWNPRTGAASVGVVRANSDERVQANAGAQLVLPPSGFDVPVAWSPDGTVLALRHFAGSSTDQAGTETIELAGDGGRGVVSGAGLTILGWVSP